MLKNKVRDKKLVSLLKKALRSTRMYAGLGTWLFLL